MSRFGLALVVGMLTPSVGVAQSGRSPLPRTAWGDPDLQGIWNNSTTTPAGADD